MNIKKCFTKIVLFVIIFVIMLSIYNINCSNNSITNDIDIKNSESDDNVFLDIYNNYYNKYVKTLKESIIYIEDNGEFKKIGIISSGEELTLKDKNKEYFLIDNLDKDYYIKYDCVSKVENLSTYSDRFNNYILFNESVSTTDRTLLYDENDNLVFTINEGLKFPVVVKFDDKYGIKFNNKLFYIHKSECNLIESNNTFLKNTPGIAVLNYHFFYDDNDYTDSLNCNQLICEPISEFKKQLDYIRDNNFFTPTMKELEMYIDGKILLPKSVVITIDDGWRAEDGIKLLNEYQLNATIFLITTYYNSNDFRSDYIEVHSHGDNIHDGGLCPGGQGGAIKCMEHDKLLSDLKTSREKLNGSKYFCYPFYEYNDYSISVLKEAGFSMAFGGEYEGGHKYIIPGIDKFRLPRFVIVNYTDMDTFTSYLNLY